MKLFKMKSYIMLTLLIVISITQSGFSKYECSEVTYEEMASLKKLITGLWSGEYTVTQNPNQPALFYSFIVYPGGELVTVSKGDDGNTYYGKGMWNLNGKTFTYTLSVLPHHNIKQKGTLTYSKKGIMSSGTWEETDNPYGLLNGTFPTMKRVK